MVVISSTRVSFDELAQYRTSNRRHENASASSDWSFEISTHLMAVTSAITALSTERRE